MLSKLADAPRDFSMDLPGSKSISLRTLVLASLATGTSRITGLANCDDIDELTSALRTLGVGMAVSEDGTYTVTGTGGKFATGQLNVQLGLSGTSTRFLIALAFLRKDATHIDGHESLRARPNKYLVDALRSLGARVDPEEASGLPVLIQGHPETRQRSVEMAGNRSSQFFSALMQIAPLLTEGLSIKVRGELVSRPYIDITTAQMKAFGVNVTWNESGTAFDVRPQSYRAVDMAVEGDASGASYFAALATVHGTAVTFRNLGHQTLQGDYGFFKLCEKLGATVSSDADTTRITGPSNGMNAVDEEIDMEDMPDVAPTLMAIAPLVPGGLRIRGLGTLRIKECDRLGVCAAHLRTLNVPVEEGPDSIVIQEHRSGPSEMVGLETFDDHRIAMSFGVLASKLGNIAILDPHCVAKTFPEYWDELQRFGIDGTGKAA
ncbi:3-phosphoshikimate 1-carboxyvinyltransferase [Variovorax sp. ZS18.2.2]|uniref:3-phosphoshikimate 1-carboxyvinyltransferase n=1 Tax=Variovorax sp. ZS18.2.2 TaxID=2971255 RepID=UPI002151E7BD|nr:3-phosphoshikimate 1-carboxyvinyltransferase [Variovorax sp. ZS18.2.2]MCR6476509.1 3-phosphoshikimate 1-carboxyvinyltransferase [Variovorax sp. ZS18.2.2]